MADKQEQDLQPTGSDEVALLSELEKLRLEVNALETQIAGKMDSIHAHERETLTEVRDIKRELVNRDEINSMIQSRLDSQLERYLTADQVIEIVNKTVGQAVAGLNRTIKDGYESIDQTIGTFSKNINKILDQHDNRLTAHDTRLDRNDIRDEQHRDELSVINAQVLSFRPQLERIESHTTGNTSRLLTVEGSLRTQIDTNRTLTQSMMNNSNLLQELLTREKQRADNRDQTVKRMKEGAFYVLTRGGAAAFGTGAITTALTALGQLIIGA